MNDIAISVKNLSKSYRMYPSPKEKLKELLHPFGKKYHQEFWALKDVSFDVKKGETIGIIGRNGSGKSTLLQMICRVLQPTAGEVMVNGRISALLELGAGFNPQFTGRDNVYLNGALMGFSKNEMDARFQTIADFADIGEFIDQPVKTYSSGMYVRLAFATAANVDPEILIIDEALAVGDLLFQKKCKEKIDEFRRRAVTIVLVSHSLYDIRAVCQRAIFLQSGRPLFVGDADAAINAYMYEESRHEITKGIENKNKSADVRDLPTSLGRDKGGTRDIYISNVICYQKGQDKNVPEIGYGENIIVEFTYDAVSRLENPIFRINFSVTGYRFFANVDSTDAGLDLPYIEGKGKILLEIKKPNLYPRAYKVNIAVLRKKVNVHFFFWSEAAGFIVRSPGDRFMAYPSAIIELDGNIVSHEVER